MSGLKTDDLITKAKSLVVFAQVTSLSILDPLEEKYKILSKENQNLEHWSFIVVSATVFLALQNLYNIGIHNDFDTTKITDVIDRKLQEWKIDGDRGIIDCKQFVNRALENLNSNDPNENCRISIVYVGMWILWNVLKRKPESNEDLELANVIGNMLKLTVNEYWSS